MKSEKTRKKFLAFLAHCGVSVDPEIESKILEYERLADREAFRKKLEKLVLKKLIPKGFGEYDLTKMLKELSTGEPKGDWLFYYDHEGLHER
ncbi:hypothetical protein [Atrimonas thermophila]|uniref:hypothetical protein n=1 Tax=Atrimonas thermophila TaxID=3064161 RepID=UPI00399D5574